jgi:CHAD domain-containing protein
MPYRFEQGETPGAALRRATLETLADASAILRAPPDGDADVAVHEARKGTKKARAALRLGRDLLRGKDRKRTDAALRSLAKALAPARDATVRLATARELARQERLPLPSDALAAWLAPGVPTAGSAAPARSLPSLADGFDEMRATVAAAGWKDGGVGELRSGLERLYADGRDAWRRVGDPPDTDRLHVCRTHVKRLGYALRLLEPAWPQLVQAESAELRRLGEALGRDHDRAVLVASLRRRSLPAELVDEAAALVAAADAETARARQLLLPTVARLFAERPKGFAHRHAAWWDRWQRDPAG